MKEIYIPVEQFEGLTSISNTGYGKSMPTEPKVDEPITTDKAPKTSHDNEGKSEERRKQEEAQRAAAEANIQVNRKKWEEKLKGKTVTGDIEQLVEEAVRQGKSPDSGGGLALLNHIFGQLDKDAGARQSTEDFLRTGREALGKEDKAKVDITKEREEELMRLHLRGRRLEDLDNQEADVIRQAAARGILPIKGGGPLDYSGSIPEIQQVYDKVTAAVGQNNEDLLYKELKAAQAELAMRGSDPAVGADAAGFAGGVAERIAQIEEKRRSAWESAQQGLWDQMLNRGRDPRPMSEVGSWNWERQSKAQHVEPSPEDDPYNFTPEEIINHHLAVLLDKTVNGQGQLVDYPQGEDVEALYASEEQKVESYKTLLRYVKILYNNATDKDEHLKMDPGKQETLKDILEEFVPNSTRKEGETGDKDPDISEPVTLAQMVKNAEKLQDKVDISKYFEGVEKRERRERGDIPNSIEETMQRIMDREGPEFREGGRYELIDVLGEVHIENFLQWVRYRAKRLHEDNPNDQINPLSQINVELSFRTLSLYDIIYTPRYLQTRKIRIAGNDNDAQTRPYESTLQGESTHVDFDSIRETALVEAWLFGVAHTNDAAYRQNRGSMENWMKMMDSFCRRNDFTNGNRLINIFKLAATDKDEFQNYSKKEEQGSVGKIMQRIMLQYNYLMEFAWAGEEDTSVDPKTGKPRSVFEGGNKFYDALGGRDSAKARALHLSLAAQALSRDGTAIGIYREYVTKQIEAWAEKQTDQTYKERARQKIEEVKSKDEYAEISFDSMNALYDLEVEAQEGKLKRALSRNSRLGIRKKIRKQTEGSIHEFVAQLQAAYAGQEGGDITAADIALFSTSPEKFGITLVEKIFHAKRTELNVFDTAEKSNEIKKLMEKAIAKGASHGDDIEDNEVDYATMWMRTLINWTGIAAKNEYQGIGFDSWSRLANSGAHLMRAKGRSGLGVELLAEDDPALKHIGMTLWEALWIKGENDTKYKTSLIDFLQGGKNGQMDVDKELGKGEFQGGAMEQVYDMHLSNAMKFMQLLLGEGEMRLDEIMKPDIYGNLMIDHHKAHPLMDNWWKSIRYTFDQIFDYNDHSITIRDYDTEFYNDENGALKRKLIFKTQSLRDHMVSHEISEMSMYNRSDYGYKKPGGEGSHEEDKLGRDVFAYLISKEIESHVGPNRTKPYWSLENVVQIGKFFRTIFNEHNQSFYNSKDFRRILKEAHTSYIKLYGKESAGNIFETLFAMITEIGKQAMK